MEGGFEGWKQNDLPGETSAGVERDTGTERSPKQ
jgi:hypothetical protein